MRVRKRPRKNSIDYSKYTRGRWPPVARLLRAEWDFVMDIAKRSGVAHGERQDVALEVFLRYHQYRWSIASPMAIRGWLRTTAIHVAADMKNRKTSRYEVPFDPDELEPENLAPSPEEELSALEGHRDLMKLIDALEPARREVFYRYADQHQAMTLLSSELGIPQGTAYNRLRLAREELREALGREAQVKEREKNRRGFAVVSFLLLLREEVLARAWRAAREAWASQGGGVRVVQILASALAVGAAVGLSPGLFSSEPAVPPEPAPQTGILAARAPEEEQAVSRPLGVSGAHGESSAQIVFRGNGSGEAQAVSKSAPGTGEIVSGVTDSPPRLPTAGPPRHPVSTPALEARGAVLAGRTGLQRGPLRLAHARLVAFAKRHPPSPYPPTDSLGGALPRAPGANSL